MNSNTSESEVSSDDEENIEFLDVNEYEPIYEGAPITVGESLMSILSLSLAFKITGVLLAQIITCIELHCMKPNKCVSSLHTFKKYFENIKTPLKRHYYCLKCKVERACNFCQKCGNNEKVIYFIEIPILQQLLSMFKRPKFYELLQHRFNRKKINEDNLEDIYDGSTYKEIEDKGYVSGLNNITFTWNSDGVKIFNSSKYSIWPYYLVINELPFSERYKKENVILAEL